MIQRSLAVLPLVLFLFLGPTATAAHAWPDVVPGDCTSAPVPERPGLGLSGWILPNPQDDQIRTGDPFAAHPTTSIYQQYGLAGFRTDVYGLGQNGSCWVQSGMDGVWIGLSNLMDQATLGSVALVAAIGQYAFHPDRWAFALDPLVTNATAAIRDGLAVHTVAIFAMLGGMLFMWNARRWPLGRALSTAGIVLLVAVGVGATLNDPLSVTRKTDGLSGQAIGGFADAINGVTSIDATAPDTAVVGQFVDSVLYPRWLAKELCSSDSQVAVKYGPVLFKAHAFSWAEDRALTRATSQAAVDKIYKVKSDEWKAAADKIKKEDPSAYRCLQGRDGVNTLDQSFVQAFGAVCSLPFLIVVLLALIAVVLLVRLALVMGGIVGPLGLHPALWHIARTPLDIGMSAVLNSILFGLAACLQVLATSVLLDPTSGLPQWMALLLLALMSLCLWIVTKPFRRLTRMVRGYDTSRELHGTFAGMRQAISSTMQTAVSAAVGARIGTDSALHHDRAERAARGRGRRSDAYDAGETLDSEESWMPPPRPQAEEPQFYPWGTTTSPPEDWRPAGGAVTGSALPDVYVPAHDDGTRWEQVHPHAPVREPAGVSAAPRVTAGALPAGTGREDVITFRPTTSAAGTDAPIQSVSGGRYQTATGRYATLQDAIIATPHGSVYDTDSGRSIGMVMTDGDVRSYYEWPAPAETYLDEGREVFDIYRPGDDANEGSANEGSATGSNEGTVTP